MDTIIRNAVAVGLFLLTGGSGTAFAQERATARKLIGLNLTNEFGYAEVKPGAFFEYIYFAKKHIEAGFKVGFVIGSSAGSIYDDSGNQLPATYLYNISKMGISLSGYWYPNRQKINKGFFICGEAGLMRTLRYMLMDNDINFPWAKTGVGYKWVLGKKKYTLRLSTGFVYIAASSGFQNRTGIQTTLAFGN